MSQSNHQLYVRRGKTGSVPILIHVYDLIIAALLTQIKCMNQSLEPKLQVKDLRTASKIWDVELQIDFNTTRIKKQEEPA